MTTSPATFPDGFLWGAATASHQQAALHVSALRDGVTLQWLLAPAQADLVEAVTPGLRTRGCVRSPARRPAARPPAAAGPA